MSELIKVEKIKVPEIVEDLEVMMFDDASVVLLQTNMSKHCQDFPIKMERWEYDHEDADYYIVGRFSVTENMSHRQIRQLSHKITKLVKREGIYI